MGDSRARIAASILDADLGNLANAVRRVVAAGVDRVHLDVMDGHFVPNITIGVPVVRALKRVATRPLDVHLMIEDPDRYVDDFASAGAAMLSVHVEAARHLHRTITHIRSRGVKAGAALNPATPASALEEIAGQLDFVLVMSVNPGFSGQEFIPQSIYKLRRVREILDRAASGASIEIDGGIDETNIADVVAAGASIVVAGQAIFGASEPESATRALRAACSSAAPFHA